MIGRRTNHPGLKSVTGTLTNVNGATAANFNSTSSKDSIDFVVTSNDLIHKAMP